jgi:hypothetical protein
VGQALRKHLRKVHELAIHSQRRQHLRAKESGEDDAPCLKIKLHMTYDYVIVNFDGRVCMKARARHSSFFLFYPGLKQLKPHFMHKGQMVLRKASGSFWPTVPCLAMWHDSLWHAPDIKQ